MIHIFFDAGSFGTTLEYVIKKFSNHSQMSLDFNPLPDGSMHAYEKIQHITTPADLDYYLKNFTDENGITTPIYPFKEYGLTDLIAQFATKKGWEQDKKILIYQPNLRASELNLLCKYYKSCVGDAIQTGLQSIIGDNQHNLQGWGDHLSHWSQMQIWQLREWLSLFYPGFVESKINACNCVDDRWLVLTNLEILYNLESSAKKIFKFCGLKQTQSMHDFVIRWNQAQHYIVEEFHLLDQIVNSSIHNDACLQWNELNIIAESIIQRRLRSLGYEIACDGLNIFPKDSITLASLLNPVYN